MAKVMRIGLVPAGTTPQAPSYTIDCGYVNYQGWDSTFYRNLETSDVFISDATPINSIVNSGSELGDFDCYLNGVIDEAHKLGFKLFAHSTHAIIYNEEIGSFINVHHGNGEGNCYLVFNNYVGTFNYGTDTIETMSQLQSYMTDVVTLGNPIIPVGIRARGMNTNDSAVLAIITEVGDHYQDTRWSGDEGSRMGTAYYNNLTGPFNWYKLMTGHFATEAPYVETINGDKIYMSVSKGSTPYINDHLLYDLSTPVFPFYDEYGKPCVSAFYQSGTDLTHLVKHPGDEIELKNGSKIKYLAVKGEDDSYHYYIELSYDDGTNHYSILSAINFYSYPYSSTSFYMPDLHYLSYTTISDKLLNSIESYKANGGGIISNGNSAGLIGAYLWLSPNVHGSIYDYIEQHNQLPPEPRSFWNNYPDTPATIGFVTKDLFTKPSTDTDGNNTSATTRGLAFLLPFAYQYNYNTYGLYRDILATNLVGRYINNNNIYYTMGTTIGIPDSIIDDLFLTAGRGGGEMNVESAVGAARLLGTDAQYSQEEPDDDYESLGDNDGSEPTGGEGDFDDSTTTIPDSSPNGGTLCKVLNMYYIGLTGSTDYITEMQHMSAWLNDTYIFNSFEDRVQGIISLKDIYTWSNTSWVQSPSTEIQIRGRDSGIMGHLIDNEIQTKTFGSYYIKPYYDDFLDYAPHTSVKIYLPFSGTYDLDPSLVVGGTITLNAKLNLISGDILYTIQVHKTNKKDPENSLNAVIYSFNGNTSGELPITSTDYSNKLSSIVNTGLGAVATMGALATGTAAGFVAAGAHTLMSEVSAIKQNGNSRTTGFTGGSVGKLGVLRPYLIITRPRRVKAKKYGSIKGFPSMASVKLSGIDAHLEGYIKVHQCNWSIPGATKSEVEAIDRLMKTEGAIL